MDYVQETGALPQDGQVCQKPRTSILTAFVPSSAETRLTAGMFLELMTVWKTKETSALSATVSSIAGNGGFHGFGQTLHLSTRRHFKQMMMLLGLTWKLRRTGVPLLETKKLPKEMRNGYFLFSLNLKRAKSSLSLHTGN